MIDLTTIKNADPELFEAMDLELMRQISSLSLRKTLFPPQLWRQWEVI